MSNNSGRILVVDDQGVSRLLLCHYLDEAGFETSSAASCEDALYQINSSSFDLVLLDIIMPGMNGMELLRILRSRFNMLELPIIMVSSLSESDDKVHALENGANDYILKPVEPQEAIARFRIHLNMHSLYSQIKNNEERFAACLHGADVGIWDWDLQQDTIYYSPRFLRIIEPDEEKIIEPRPQEWFDRIHPDDRESVLTALKEHLDGKNKYFLSQHRIQYSDGSSCWVYARGTASGQKDGKPLRITGAIVDISQSMTYIDNVTGLITKRLFCNVLEKALAKSLRSENNLFALLTIEINKYGEFEEQLGSVEISKMIASISRRLQLSSRASDTIALLKPYEFGIILDDLNDTSDALRVARRIIETVSGPMLISDHLFTITCSIGIALSCSESDTPETMLGFAEQAMQSAKAIGDNQCIIYDSKLHAISNKRLSLESSFNEALSQQKFFLLFRPIVNTNTGAICGTESHIRWKYGDEILTPRDFLDIIEQSSSLGTLGNWNLYQATDHLKVWHKLDKSYKKLSLYIHIHIAQITNGSYLSSIKSKLIDSEIEAECIKICISEKSAAENFPQALAAIQALKEIGIGTGLTNFGKGLIDTFSLLQLPIEFITIDSEVTEKAATDPHTLENLRKLSKIADCFGINFIVNGVKTKEQSEMLNGICHLQQGEYFSAPADAPAITKLLKKNLVKA